MAVIWEAKEKERTVYAYIGVNKVREAQGWKELAVAQQYGCSREILSRA